MSAADVGRIGKFNELVKQGYNVRGCLKEAGLIGRDYRTCYSEIWSDPWIENSLARRRLEQTMYPSIDWAAKPYKIKRIIRAKYPAKA